jgi:23S rRNA maturation-related 3'-5' exoribonuclease YhaM
MKYDCMRAVMDNHTEKCGRLSDYGLIFAKYYAEACEMYPAHKII